MKTPPSNRRQTAVPSFRAERRGFALVLVLGIIALLVILVTAFLARSMTERSAAAGYRASGEARQFGDIAVNLVQGQINHATTRGSNIAWVSQPGMVRTFNQSGGLVNAYKLYSAPEMIASSGNVTADLPPADWAANTGLWVDLNAPVTANGTKNFPIADPAALDAIGSVQGLNNQGFSVTSAPGASTYQPLPMPVRWLYVLRDGTLVAPAAGGNGVQVASATQNNPIVGRIAFWTDDDTSKVNINTASEGIFWDVPRGYTNTEVLQLAVKQPWNGEYNRYPGHPATVSLSAVLPVTGFNPDGTFGSGKGYEVNATTRGILDNYLRLTPSYRFGGSEAGTVLIPYIPSLVASPIAMDRKAERLYTSVDEMMFQPDRQENSLITKEVIESRKFFLTAHSRAPETNLFNLPRIASWPIYRLVNGSLSQSLTNADWMRRTNAFDRLIAFCSSIRGAGGAEYPYFFQRENAYSDQDLLGIPRNMQLYRYLQHLTSEPVPGFGGRFSSKYSFAGERDQILTQIYDYIRIINLYDDQLDVGQPVKGVYPFTNSVGESVNAQGDLATGEGEPGHGIVLPSEGPNNTRGQGRYHTLRQLAVVLITCADGADAPGTGSNIIDPSNANFNPMLKDSPAAAPVALAADQLRVQAMVVPFLTTTMAGTRFPHPNLTIEIEGLEQFGLRSGLSGPIQNLRFPSSGWVHTKSGAQHWTGSSLAQPDLNYRVLLQEKDTPYDEIPVSSGGTRYPFISAPVTVSKTSALRLMSSNSPITVRLYYGEGTSGPLIQTLTMTPPPMATVPTPTLHSDPKFWSAFNTRADKSYGRGRVRQNGATNAIPGPNPIWIPETGSGQPDATKGDVLRAFVADGAGYDFRLVAATRDDTTSFAPHPLFASASSRVAAHWDANPPVVRRFLEEAPASIYTGGIIADNIPGDKTFAQVNVGATGDFDLAPGGSDKGSLANKPDDGEIHRENNANWAGVTADSRTAPYFNWNRSFAPGPTFFSPNRMMPSPVMFGSLPTGVKQRIPWRTLLFRPLAALENSHIGAQSPHDHLLLDLFWMPVVEPYAISDRFSTAGKINMNYQILPFTYIERSTGMRAVLKSQKISLLDLNQKYNSHVYSAGPTGSQAISSTLEYRQAINAAETLKQFQERFDQSNKDTNVFLSASEICEQYLIPSGSPSGATPAVTSPSYTGKGAMATWWNAYRQTGDNLRERPYAMIYPKLTTKSNTFTVHFRAQSLKKGLAGDPDVWVEGKDKVTGEYRGSTTIERFIDPDAEVPDYAANPSGISGMQTLDAFYKWRVVQNRQFAP